MIGNGRRLFVGLLVLLLFDGADPLTAGQSAIAKYCHKIHPVPNSAVTGQTTFMIQMYWGGGVDRRKCRD